MTLVPTTAGCVASGCLVSLVGAVGVLLTDVLRCDQAPIAFWASVALSALIVMAFEAESEVETCPERFVFH